MYEKICEYAYLKNLDRIRGVPFSAVLKESRKNQHLQTRDLEQLQLNKINETLKIAVSKSTFYEHALAGVRLPLQTTGEICSLPMLSKNSLAENMNAILTTKTRKGLFKSYTSGSTGVALEFFSDGRQRAWSEAVQWRGRGWWNLSRGERQLVLWGRPIKDRKTRGYYPSAKYRLRNCVQFNTFEDFDDARLWRIVKILKTFRPRMIYGYGSSIGRLARFMEDHGIFLKDEMRPQIVEYTADHMLDEEIRAASRVFGAPVLSAYGASETPGISQQCWVGNSHISVDNVFVEFLRPDGQRAEEGETSELLVTTLNNLTMPLIRYKVGDLGSYSNSQCICGVTLPIMNLKMGKTADLITTSTHASVSAHFLDYVNISMMREGLAGIGQFFVEQIAIDSFRLDYVPTSAFDPETVAEFVRRMKMQLGNQIVVEVRRVNDVPLSSSGKRQYFRSRLIDR